MALSESFQEIVDSLPRDWTDMQLDLRISDESRYVDASIPMTQINAQPYSEADWHWRINVAHGFGHAAAPETVSTVSPEWLAAITSVRFPAQAGSP